MKTNGARQNVQSHHPVNVRWKHSRIPWKNRRGNVTITDKLVYYLDAVWRNQRSQKETIHTAGEELQNVLYVDTERSRFAKYPSV